MPRGEKTKITITKTTDFWKKKAINIGLKPKMVKVVTYLKNCVNVLKKKKELTKEEHL